jgi:ankyrin repeat protein
MSAFLTVSHGADLELKNKDGWTAFHIAARTGDHQLIAFLADISPAAWSTVSREQTNCFKGTVSRDGFGLHVWLVLGLITHRDGTIF